MYEIRLEIDFTNFMERLEVLQEALQDLSPFWREKVIPNLDRRVVDIFSAQPWQSLDPRYIKRKERERPGKPILRYDDDYLRSYTEHSTEHHIQVINKKYMEYGSSIPYASAHEYGNNPEHVESLPERQVLGLIDHQAELRRLMNEYLNELIK